MSKARAYRSRSRVTGRWQSPWTDGGMAFGRITTHSVLICEQQEHRACGCRCWEVMGVPVGVCRVLFWSPIFSANRKWKAKLGKWCWGFGEKNQKSGTVRNQEKHNTVVMSHPGLYLKLPGMNLEDQFCFRNWVHFLSCAHYRDVSNGETGDLMLWRSQKVQ